MLKKYFLISTIFLISFLISNFLIKNLFLANSPRINPFFVNNMKVKIKNYLSINFNDFNNYKNNKIVDDKESFGLKIATTPLKKISRGTYAGEIDGIHVTKIVMDELEYNQYIFNVDGRQIKVKIPKGEPTPNQKVLEALYK
jgi:hypothetical protein